VNERTRRLLGRAAVFGVTGAVVTGLILLDPPWQERARRLDDLRVQQLTAIARTVDLVYGRTGELPATLDELHEHGGELLAIRDPATGRPYEYQVEGPTTFSLCAEFQYASGTRTPDFWTHAAGPVCFALTPEEISR
jgi:hypothetical protein